MSTAPGDGVAPRGLVIQGARPSSYSFQAAGLIQHPFECSQLLPSGRVGRQPRHRTGGSGWVRFPLASHPTMAPAPRWSP